MPAHGRTHLNQVTHEPLHTRDTHSPFEMLDEDELENTIKLLQAFLEHRPAVG